MCFLSGTSPAYVSLGLATPEGRGHGMFTSGFTLGSIAGSQASIISKFTPTPVAPGLDGHPAAPIRRTWGLGGLRGDCGRTGDLE